MMATDKGNDRGDKHDDRPQDDNQARPVTTTSQDKTGNGRTK
jgi:hypothetical protein